MALRRALQQRPRQQLALLSQRGVHATRDADADPLFFEEVAAQPPAAAAAAAAAAVPPCTLLVVHGLLGVGRNLRSLAAALVGQAAEQSGRPWRAILVDQRNHGGPRRATLRAAAGGEQRSHVTLCPTSQPTK